MTFSPTKYNGIHCLILKDMLAYRKEIANYILRHPKNSRTTDDVKKYIELGTCNHKKIKKQNQK